MTASRFALRHALIAWLGTLMMVSACGKGARSDSGPIWLHPCTKGYECYSGLSCLCGVCTVECKDVNDCLPFGDTAMCEPGSKLTSSCAPTLCLRQGPEGSGGSPGSGGGAGAGARETGGTTASGGASASGGVKASGGAGGRTSIADASVDGDSSIPDGSLLDGSLPDGDANAGQD
jgi:hypothetical protein